MWSQMQDRKKNKNKTGCIVRQCTYTFIKIFLWFKGVLNFILESSSLSIYLFTSGSQEVKEECLANAKILISIP